MARPSSRLHHRGSASSTPFLTLSSIMRASMPAIAMCSASAYATWRRFSLENVPTSARCSCSRLEGNSSSSPSLRRASVAKRRSKPQRRRAMYGPSSHASSGAPHARATSPAWRFVVRFVRPPPRECPAKQTRRGRVRSRGRHRHRRSRPRLPGRERTSAKEGPIEKARPSSGIRVYRACPARRLQSSGRTTRLSMKIWQQRLRFPAFTAPTSSERRDETGDDGPILWPARRRHGPPCRRRTSHPGRC